MTQYRRNRVYQARDQITLTGRTIAGKRSIYVDDVVPDQVTLRRNLSNPFSRRRNTQTPFFEISIVPPTKVVGKTVRRLMAKTIKRTRVSDQVFAKRIFTAMCSAVERAWKPNVLHIVQHSSGWDSRLISLAIRHLAAVKGESWLGNVLFLELNGEGPSFKQIIKSQGWSNEIAYVWNEGAPPREHHLLAFEFSQAWRRLNGWCAYPVNVNWHPFQEMRDRGILPEPGKMQVFSGYGANEVGAAVAGGQGGFKSYVNKMYWHPLSSFPLWGGEEAWSFPFLDLDYIKAYASVSGSRGPNYRKMVVGKIAPKVGKVAPINKQHKQKLGYRTASKAILARCVADYEASWLGREVFPIDGKWVAPRPQINYHDWWGYWSLASFCEELMRRGTTIRVR